MKALFFLPFLFLSPGDDPFEKASKELADALSGKDLPKKIAAVEAVAKLGDARGFPLLVKEFGFLSNILVEHERKERNSTIEAEQKKRRLDERARTARSEEERLEVERERLNFEIFQKETLDPLRKNLEEERPLQRAVREAAFALFKSLPAARKTKETETLRKQALEDPNWSNRGPAMELYAGLGDANAPAALLKELKDALKDRVKLQSTLTQKRAQFDKLQKAIQKAAEENKGLVSKPLQDDYRKAQGEVAKITDQIDAGYRIAEFAKKAAAIAPLSLEGEARQKAVALFVQEASKGEPATRLATIELLGNVDDPQAREGLRSILQADSDPAAKALAIRSLAALRDPDSLGALLDQAMKDASWEVRAAAIRALASIRSKDAVPRLIAVMESETGRLQQDCDEVLQNLTGKDFKGNAALWKKWWEESQVGFQLAEAKPLSKKAVEASAPGQTVVSFYGIKTRSQRLIFVLDTSGSMNFGLGKKDNEFPNEGESSRMEIAKQELTRAIGAIPEGGLFNIIVFATDVKTWQPTMVLANEVNRNKAKAFVDGLQAAGGTNFAGALAKLFETIGIVSDHGMGATADTVYFLSDGKPTDGELLEAEKILEFIRQKNRLARIALHTIGVSGEADLALMQRMAEENDGTFVSR